jgi:hypothetical protein
MNMSLLEKVETQRILAQNHHLKKHSIKKVFSKTCTFCVDEQLRQH